MVHRNPVYVFPRLPQTLDRLVAQLRRYLRRERKEGPSVLTQYRIPRCFDGVRGLALEQKAWFELLDDRMDCLERWGCSTIS